MLVPFYLLLLNIEFISFHFQGIFDGAEFRNLIIVDDEFAMTLNKVNFRSWVAFEELVQIIFGNRRGENYHELIDELISSFQDLHYAAVAMKQCRRNETSRRSLG